MTTPTPKARPMTPSRLQWRLARGRLWRGTQGKDAAGAVQGQGKPAGKVPADGGRG